MILSIFLKKPYQPVSMTMSGDVSRLAPTPSLISDASSHPVFTLTDKGDLSPEVHSQNYGVVIYTNVINMKMCLFVYYVLTYVYDV